MSAVDMHAVMEHGLGVLRTLWQVTWQGALCALAVWALTRLLPRLPASVRTMLWWFVALKCLVGLGAPGPVRLPLLPAPEAPVAVVRTVAPAMPIVGETTPEVHALEMRAPKPPETHTDWRPLLLGALCVWLGGIAWQGRELLRGLVQLRRIRREARPLEDASLQQAAEVLGRELGLTRVPPLLVSEHAPSPLALGLLRPEIILPRRALETLSPLEQRMALAHELAHVRRGDLWLGWVPALAQVALFFHPLVRRACREYALAREEACDAAALQATGAGPREYGRLLLVFGVARAPAAAAVPGASSHLAALKRRIAMLEHAGTDSKHRARWVRWTLGGLALVALVPFQVVARETPTATPLLAVAAPPVPPKPPVPPSAPIIVDNEDEDDMFAYVLLRPNNDASMAGSRRDVRRARALVGNGPLPVLYLRRDEQEYLIRDAATLKAFESTFAPVEEIGKKQSAMGEKMSELGEKMGELGGRQGDAGGKMGELGEKMGALGGKQGEIGAKMGELTLKQAELSRAQDRYEQEHGKESPELAKQMEQLEREEEALDKQMDEIGEQMDALGREMEKASEPMDEIGREMEKLSAPMEEYGRQMDALGEQMEKAHLEAMQKARTLLDDAVRKGTAEPVKR
ncbi:MAG TPA: M56 family metallopeptidase [Archangium sp.]|uniref:M56 family metallopeptidase n=1 Tax=Archangium sp. TaxID=1872627 RepID=UPI002E381EFB|nr:M56 family metallopeptidase [Archangium sp.]HEX5749022.1 M56 family metallopeptidase [Archangium sp.]